MKQVLKGFYMAISMFTIIPLPYCEWDDDSVKHIMKFYPLVGLIIGCLWYAVYKGLVIVGASEIIIAAITMITPFIITGMLHLDGYMDVCDAILSRREKSERIRILKDPNTGAFAVISLAMLFIIDFAVIYTVIDNKKNIFGIILIPIISRGLSALFLLIKDAMPQSSLGSYFKKNTGTFDIIIVTTFLITASIGMVVFLGGKALLIPLGMGITSLLVVNNSIKQLGGISGDSAGHALVISEVIGVLLLALI